MMMNYFQLTYKYGEPLDISNLTLNVTYEDGTTGLVAVKESMVTGFNSVYAEESLNIESNSLHGSDTAYMSVLDMYKVKLFDSKVSERKEQLKKQKEIEKEEMYNSVFSKEITEQLSESEEFEQEVKKFEKFVDEVSIGTSS